MELGLDDAQLVVQVREPECRLEEEPVELGLGQRERPLVVKRVLRREDEKRVQERVRTRRPP